MKEYSLSEELYREYEWEYNQPVTVDDTKMYEVFLRRYRIDNPSKLFLREGGTTHRVIDDNNIAHCVPAPGHMGCVLRWATKDSNNPVQF